MKRLLYAICFWLAFFLILRPCWGQDPSPTTGSTRITTQGDPAQGSVNLKAWKDASPKPLVPSAIDALKVREIQLRVSAAQLMQKEGKEREQKALAELQQVAQEIHQRTGCALRETDDGKLTCVEPPKPEKK